MPKCIFTVGCSSAGKSTFAKTLPVWDWVVIERDEARREILRQTVDYKEGELWVKWNFKNENLVNDIVDSIKKQAIEDGKNIIFSDTWLNKDRLSSKKKEMESFGYEVEVKYFPVSDFDDLVKRDRKRIESVGEGVLRKQWKQWLDLGEEITGFKRYSPESTKSRCFVFDIDGTIANMSPDRGPFDWDKVDLDSGRYEVLSVLVALHNAGNKIVFLSGRDEICKEKTVEWIALRTGFKNEDIEIYMRPRNSFEKDRKIKYELFYKEVVPRYNVVGVFDDRRQMIHMWNDIGVPCFNVGSPYDDF